VGELLSTIGSGLTAFGLGVYVYQQTGLATATALVSLLALLPTVLLGPLAGVLADRCDRRKLMVLGDGLSALGLFYILFCVLRGNAGLVQICIGVLVSSLFASLLEPAYRATITDLIPQEQYAKASGLVQMAGSAKFLISPFLAGLLMKFSGITLILCIDIGTFFITVTATLFVARSVRQEKKTVEGRFWAELAEGVRILKGKPGVMQLVLLAALVCFFLTFIQTLSAPLLLAFTDEATLGTVETICAVGMLVSSLLIGVRSIRGGYVKTLAMAFLGIGVFMILFGLREHILLITASGFLFFMCLSFANTCLDILVRQNIPNEAQGRAWGMIGLISQLGYVAANAIVGVLTDYVFDPALQGGRLLYGTVGKVIGTGPGRGAALLILIGGVCMCALAPCIYRSPKIRALEK
jgi:MFS transporter, DHA3 family, macrolide efflux protein